MSQVCDDLLMAYPVVDSHRCQRLAELAHGRQVRVAVDSLLSVQRLAAAAQQAGSIVGILVDLDVGFGRTGLQSAGEHCGGCAWQVDLKTSTLRTTIVISLAIFSSVRHRSCALEFS